MKHCILSAWRLVFKSIPMAFFGALIATLVQGGWILIQPLGLLGEAIGSWISFSIAFSVWYLLMRNMYFKPSVGALVLVKNIFPIVLGKSLFGFATITFSLGIFFSFLLQPIYEFVVLPLHIAMETFYWYESFSNSIYGTYVGMALLAIVGLCALVIGVLVYFGFVYYMSAIRGFTLDDPVGFLNSCCAKKINSDYEGAYDFLDRYKNSSSAGNDIRGLFLGMFYTLFLISISIFIAIVVYGNLLKEDAMSNDAIDAFVFFMLSFSFMSISFMFFHLSLVGEFLSDMERDAKKNDHPN